MKYLTGEAKQKRDLKIYYKIINGYTKAETARMFMLSPSRIDQIYCKLEMIIEIKREQMAKKILNI